ncbi:glycoprotein precursor [Mammarenavirus bearense]|uniref:Pre-glycoprotein polyprotein GP complex n=1 Tax=Bear Canyon mammarenavirus (isolate Mouse/United States/AV A0070039/2000) TaxID=3052298 RepID=GLYC_BCNVU|nr:glycoprotein precursor [Mammarenavirus bearense]A0PJ25.1 RecName: Full=Pre-glycoprotein polyprotein GP complex; Short=Pre-GP-C; Contains: RecName: Full=Stable signal peptide; Short=SSP; Contains: RecName: Full=Glycoprotein G1; Short=GP1; Contains: RecName: Full=Glycoprotein G2; Short=GP2 [Mammarenavirus bearense]AAX99345.1 glycoprotein precursor [Mammarenavirus bearense]
MGQLVSFIGEIPAIVHEALNVALIAVSIIAIMKGLINIWKSGLFQLIMFLILAGRSCSISIGHHLELQHFIINSTSLLPSMPTLCRINATNSLIRGPFSAQWGLDIFIGDLTILVNPEPGSKTKRMTATNITGCFPNNEDPDSVAQVLSWFFRGVHHDFHLDPTILCDESVTVFRIQMNLTERMYCDRIVSKLARLFGSFGDYCSKVGKKLVIIRNVTWSNQCHEDHVGSMQLILQNAHNQVMRFRKLQNFFSWSLVDSAGNSMPGGYCLEKWMLVASELKCFGNTAVAKCNINHDSEFCDMLRLFDYNKKAIVNLQDKTKAQLDSLIDAVNSLISDNLITKNKIRELMNIPYCNYTKFWYVNHTGLNVHSLPKCWHVRNGSYLNESDFRNEWIIESDHLVSEILAKEYEERQKRTPLSLVDLCFWSTLFYTASIFLHLLHIPTHRHIIGEGCPKPHRLTSDSLCACGFFQLKGRPTRWARIP